MECFKKVSGAPRFKKKGRKDSFSLDGSIKVEHFKIKVPVIGRKKSTTTLSVGQEAYTVPSGQCR